MRALCPGETVEVQRWRWCGCFPDGVCVEGHSARRTCCCAGTQCGPKAHAETMETWEQRASEEIRPRAGGLGIASPWDCARKCSTRKGTRYTAPFACTTKDRREAANAPSSQTRRQPLTESNRRHTVQDSALQSRTRRPATVAWLGTTRSPSDEPRPNAESQAMRRPMNLLRPQLAGPSQSAGAPPERRPLTNTAGLASPT